MSRQPTKKERKDEILDLVAKAFCELGYRGATTAKLAACCGVQQPILYRLWDGKKAMFLASIEYLVEWRMNRIRAVLEKVPAGEDHVGYLIEDVASTLGEHHLQRIIYAALGELGDPEIRDALGNLYRRNHALILELLSKSEEAQGPPAPALDKDAAWAVMGLVTMMNLTSELELLGPRQRKQAFKRMARSLLGLAPD